MRSEPASWSGVSMHASITSTRICAQRSCSSSGWMPFARCSASALPHFAANVAWFTTWWRLTPTVSSVPDVCPSKWTTVAKGW